MSGPPAGSNCLAPPEGHSSDLRSRGMPVSFAFRAPRDPIRRRPPGALLSKKAMKKQQPPAWRSFLPGGLAASNFSLDELRATKLAHSFLTEQIQGPEGLAYYVRGFRCLLFFGIACISENKYPPLTRCWKHLEKCPPRFAISWANP